MSKRKRKAKGDKVAGRTKRKRPRPRDRRDLAHFEPPERPRAPVNNAYPVAPPSSVVASAPTGRFLTKKDKPFFRKLLSQQYAGLVVDRPEHAASAAEHEEVQTALKELGAEGSCASAQDQRPLNLYRFDVTQPHGLNTALARTYVTRTCVGEVRNS